MAYSAGILMRSIWSGIANLWGGWNVMVWGLCGFAAVLTVMVLKAGSGQDGRHGKDEEPDISLQSLN